MNLRINHLLPNIYRQIIILIVSIFFISSGILKLINIDDFEIYIYSFGILNFGTISLLSRLLISIEIILGLLILLNIHYKKAWILMLFSMIAFSLFLVYIEFFRDDSNCFCMGSLVELNPISSLFKNLIIILLLAFINKPASYSFRKKRVLTILIFTIPTICAFTIVPPYPALSKVLRNENIVNSDAFETFIFNNNQSNLIIKNTDYQNKNNEIGLEKDTSAIIFNENESYLIGFIHPGCHFCILAVEKLELIFEHHKLDKNKTTLFVWGDDNQISNFIEKTQAYDFNYRIIDPLTSINITYGIFPTFLLYKENKILREFNYTSLNEKEISLEIKKADK
jgi:hypothetical protein